MRCPSWPLACGARAAAAHGRRRLSRPYPERLEHAIRKADGPRGRRSPVFVEATQRDDLRVELIEVKRDCASRLGDLDLQCAGPLVYGNDCR